MPLFSALYPSPQENTIQDLYMKLCLKQLKQGKLMKKGHVVHNWKWRWFILTTAELRYYESQESPIPKVHMCHMTCSPRYIYCRSGFNCEYMYLLIANCEYFLHSQLIDSQI